MVVCIPAHRGKQSSATLLTRELSSKASEHPWVRTALVLLFGSILCELQPVGTFKLITCKNSVKHNGWKAALGRRRHLPRLVQARIAPQFISASDASGILSKPEA